MFFPEIELANNTDKICYLLFSSVLILAKEFLNILNDGVGYLWIEIYVTGFLSVWGPPLPTPSNLELIKILAYPFEA